MAQMGRPRLTAEQKRELWWRWRAGESLSEIGRERSLPAACRCCGVRRTASERKSGVSGGFVLPL